MSALSCFQEEDSFSSSFNEDFSNMVSRSASRLAAEEELKNDVLKETRALALCLTFGAQHSIGFSSHALEVIQGILNGLESHLNGETEPLKLDSDSYAELRTLYRKMAQALCIILIREADSSHAKES